MIDALLMVILVAVGWAYLYQRVKRDDRFPPGPMRIPIVGNMLQLGPRPHEGITRIGKKYGKIFSLKIGSCTTVVLNDAEIIRKAMKMEGFEGRPTHLPIMKLLPGGISYAMGKTWREQRRFTIQKLKDFGYAKNAMEGVILGEVQELVSYLKGLEGKAIWPGPILQTSALNCIWSITAGSKYSLTDPAVYKMQEIAFRSVGSPPVGAACYFLPWLTNTFPKLTGFSVCLDLAPKYLKMCWEVVEKNLETYSAGQERHFLDSYWKKIQETRDEESSFYKQVGEKNLESVLAVLFIAGSDTLSATVAWSILYLRSYPEKLGKLVAELDAVVGKGNTALLDMLPRLPYTEATMAEILRITSILPNSLLHSTTRPLDFEGYHLPEGTIVIPNLYGVHHDPKVWGDPENFRPERFLGPDGKFKKSEVLMAFCVGKRVCPVENVAMAEFFLYLTSLVMGFYFEFDEEKHSIAPTLLPQVNIVMHPQEYFVSFKPRNG